jgi:signal transduction histidine kinase
MEQLSSLQEASLAITASLQTPEALARIIRAVRAALTADAAVLFAAEPGRADLALAASDGLPPSAARRDHVHATHAEAAVGKSVKERRVVGVEDRDAAPLDLRRSDSFAASEGFRAVLAAPLAAHDSLLGALALYSRAPRSWRNDEAVLLSVFASQAAVVLQNARLYERMSRRAGELRALSDLSHLLGSFVRREPLLSAVIRRLAGWMEAQFGAVLLVDRGEQGEAELKIRAHQGFSDAYVARVNAPGGISLDPRSPTGNGPASVAVREARPCAVGDVTVDAGFAPFRAYAASAGYLSLVAVPVASRGHVWGCIVLYFSRRRDFPQTALNLLTAAADGVALALERIDLSERLVHEAAMNRSFEETDRLKAEFVSTVSHELRTPLAIIKGYTDLIVSGQAGPLEETQERFLLGVQRNTTRLTELVSDLLDMSRLESSAGKCRQDRVDLAQLVGDACAEYERAAAERNITLAFEPPADAPPDVCGDAERLRQVVNNLLSNAVKFSPPGERVLVGCAADAGRGEVGVSVSDRGPGIPEEAQGRLFQKFYRVESPERRVGGTGLGLAIAKAIVEQHGGRIWVESAPGAGSRFAFALPVASADAGRPG